MFHEYENAASRLEALVNEITATLVQAIDRRDLAGLAVSGGRSPIPLFERLSKVDLPWDKVHVALVDERFTSPDSVDSNEHLTRNHMLINRAKRAHFTGLVSDPFDLTKSVEQANKQTGAIDLAILGMGDNGHTASLFPKAPQLPQALDMNGNKRYMHLSPVTAPYERISMTLPALLQAGRLILAIAGSPKKRVYEQASKKTSTALPISYLINQTGVPFDAYWSP
jgi:6-phosphogluconolactonase